jgi:hypothetical protein
MQMERLTAFVEADMSVADRLFAAAADVVVTTIENLDSTTVFFRSLHQLTADTAAEVRRQRRRYHETFRGIVTEGQQTGVFRDDIPADLVVDYFFGSVHHLPMWWRADGPASAADVGASFATLLLDGLRRP